MDQPKDHQPSQKKITITFHTQYYPPEIGAPQSRLSELAIELSHLGFDVRVLTAMPNYPTGKLFSGYSGVFRKENIDGITVYRSFIYPTQSIRFAKRLINYFSFTFSSLILGCFLPKTDFVFTESPPLFLGITGFLLSRIKHARWIFNVADLWPASVEELGLINKENALYKISQRMEEFFYRKAVVVTGQSKTILENISTRFPEVITYHLSNGVIPENFQVTGKTINNKIRIMYAGLHGLAQGLDQILESAYKLRDNNLLEFILLGDGPEKQQLMNRVNDQKIDNIRFLDPIPKAEIPKALASADILLVPLKIQLSGAVPSKLYEGMAAGKPIILIAESEAAEIVQTSNCGVVVKPGDVNTLTDSIQQLALDPEKRERMGANGKKTANLLYNRKIIAQEFAEYLHRMIP